MIGMPNSAEITVCSVGFQPTMKFSGRNNRSVWFRTGVHSSAECPGSGTA